MHIYSLVGTEVSFSQHEDRLIETLSVALLEDDISNFMDHEQMATPEEGVTSAKEIMERLRAISMMRQSLYK